MTSLPIMRRPQSRLACIVLGGVPTAVVGSIPTLSAALQVRPLLWRQPEADESGE